MKIVNLKPTVYSVLDQSESEKVATLLPDGFEVTRIKTDTGPNAIGTYVFFKFIPKKKEVKLTDKSVLKFNVDKDGYSFGWIDVSKEIEGFIEEYSDDMNDIKKSPWNGVQYNRSIHFDTKIREPRCKTWTAPCIGQILDYSYKTYDYDTELSNMQISETLNSFAKKFIF